MCPDAPQFVEGWGGVSLALPFRDDEPADRPAKVVLEPPKDGG